MKARMAIIRIVIFRSTPKSSSEAEVQFEPCAVIAVQGFHFEEQHRQPDPAAKLFVLDLRDEEGVGEQSRRDKDIRAPQRGMNAKNRIRLRVAFANPVDRGEPVAEYECARADLERAILPLQSRRDRLLDVLDKKDHRTLVVIRIQAPPRAERQR